MSSRFRNRLAAFAALSLVAGCDRERRHDSGKTGAPAIPKSASPDTIFPGSPPPAVDPRAAAFEGNASAISKGQQLYIWMNCVGCHSHGGGGMGPPLMDDKWRYGGRIDQIASSIAEGRPNGMPSWRVKLTDEQIWQLAAYVRSLSGQVRKDAVGARTDSMSNTPPQTQIPPEPVKPAEFSAAMIRRGAVLAGAATALGGCNRYQTSLGGDAAESANFLSLFWIFMAVCTVMYVLLVGAMLVALWRGRKAVDPLVVENGRHHASAPVLRPLLIGWTALILVGLTGLTIASFFTDRSNAANAADPKLVVSVTANQWWWDVEYSLQGTTTSLRTANELHLPVGVPAEVTLESNDVIHSLWIPNLAGKQDLIPGRVTDLQIWPKKTGLYRGQCAEFCGLQHAHMALDVTVESKADFVRWLTAQKQPAFAPQGPIETAGYRYVTSRACASCHTITGTPAGGKVGPDLTHFASRRSIAAGTRPMDHSDLNAWIADPQGMKPGTNMPKIPMRPDEVRAVVAYLERLK